MTTILYVDDEALLLNVARHFLERDGGFVVDVATSAPEALARMRQKDYSAVVSDYQMPKMDGITFLKEVRASGNTIPFILFTGKGREEIVIQALNEGADFYLQKGGEPTAQFTELAHKLRLAIGKKEAESSVRDHEQREQEIINFLPDPTLAIDRNGIVIAWNRAIEEMTGIPASQMLGKGNYEYALPFYGERRPILVDLVFSAPEEILSRYTSVVRAGPVIEAETGRTTLRGENRTLWGRASLLYDQHGKVEGAIESIRDITPMRAAERELRNARDVLEERVRQRTADLSAANRQLNEAIQAHRETGAALRESEAQNRAIIEKDYRSILENIQDVFYRTDTEGRISLISPSGARLFGYAGPEEMVGIPATEFYADPAERDRLLAAVKEHGSVENLELIFRKRDGTPVPVATSSHVYHDAAGQYAGLEGIIRDISRLRQAQEDLRASEEQYRVLITHIQDGAFIVQDGLLVFCNDALAAMAGYTKEEVTGKRILDLTAPEDREMIRGRQVRRLAGTMPAEPYEFRLLHKDQVTRVPVLMMVGTGTYRGRPAIIGTMRDVTRERQQIAALLESEEKYRTLVEAANEAIIIVQDGIIAYVNPSVSRLLAESAEALVGKPITDFLWPDDRELVLARHLKRAAGADVPSNYDFRVIGPDGEMRWVLISAARFPWKGRPATVNLLTDIHDRKRAETALQKANRQLMTMTRITRHDISNQVLAILAFLEIVKLDALPPQLEGCIRSIESATRTIQSQIEFTKIYQDLVTHEPQWLDMHTLVAGLSVPEPVTLVSDLAGIAVYADAMLGKVLYNFVDNSLRHGGHVSAIHVTAGRSGDDLVIVYEDNGTGIPAEEKEEIFERGFGKNTGLGLFLSREILDMTGITIRETGVPGAGARFELLVPAGMWRSGGNPS